MKQLHYSIVIPALNEAKTIGVIIYRVKNIMNRLDGTAEILVIDDGSTDQTPDIAEKMGVTVIRNKQRLGKGAALRRGFATAKGDIVVTIDADGSHLPEEIPLLIKPLLDQEADVVIGIRNQLDKSVVHLFGNQIFNIIFTLFFNRTFRDTQCGFRSFKKEVLNDIQLTASRFEIETEMLVKWLLTKQRIQEVTVRHHSRYAGSTRIRVLKDGFDILRVLILSTLKAI